MGIKLNKTADGREHVVLEPELAARLESAVRASSGFSLRVGESLARVEPREFDTSLVHVMERVKPLFQKWTLEMLFVLAVAQKLRFNQIKSRLEGISSRTLSTKLQELEAMGLVDRNVVNERPVRIEYRLSEQGRVIAGLTAPLVVYMSLEPARVVPALATIHADDDAPATQA
ncbi:MAG TPA: helix-turn-helix domain-containing protein [Candidatus Thermoplasmatota archaeon]|nr:helix-turn-helix domain-containing protein [Candidatus Thermoplasmatota archaeon]